MSEDLIESIRAALASDATVEMRAAGVAACRTILTALDATSGAPRAPTPIQMGPTADAIAALIRSMPPDQLLDTLIEKLRSIVPADAQAIAAPKMTIPLVKVPRPSRTGGTS